MRFDTRNLDELNVRLSYQDVYKLGPKDKAWLTRQCQTNLRLLVNCVLRPASKKFMPLKESVHGPIIDSFMQPDPDKTFDQWSPIKERVTKAFRGATKSTIVGGHLVQLQLCDPNIRVLILSGKLPHAKTILISGSQPFATNEVLRFLFPEWMIRLEDISGDSFTSPRRDPTLNLRDPTLSIASFDSVKAGGHFEELIFDDCTNEINCATQELVEKNEQNYDDTDPLVEPGGTGGYRHFLGTRWAPDDSDLPEVIIRRGQVYAEEHNGDQNTLSVSVPAWRLREGKDATEKALILERDRRNTLLESDVILAWPEKLDTRFLFQRYRANPDRFNRQYLLRFTGNLLRTAFTRDLLLRNTRPFAEGAPRPHDRYVVINWDLSGVYSGRRARSASDYTCGLAAMFELSTRRLFIYDAVMEVFSSSTEMATAIVNFFVKQLQIGPVGACSLEDRGGARFIEGEVNDIAKKAQVPLTLTWNMIAGVTDSKNSTIVALAGAMQRDLIQFSTTLPQRDLIFRQFEKWAPMHKTVKDDAPDCAAQIWYHFSDKIHPAMIAGMQPSGDTFWEPEPLAPGSFDPHADERENADIAVLQRMTAPHAG